VSEQTPPILSKQLDEIAEVVGAAAAIRLAESPYGGQEGCCVPHTPRPDHPWADILGMDAFQRLCRAMGGSRITIPRNALARSVKARMGALKAQGLSHRAIARQLTCTERYVRMVMNAGSDPRQGQLFGED
jgi:hypothetical protein